MINYLDYLMNRNDHYSMRITVICYNMDKSPPKYVMDTLSRGWRNPVLGKFDKNDILAELDGLLKYCKDNNVNKDINIKTLTYIRNCRKQKYSRNIELRRKYLKENKLLAVAFDNES